MKNRLMLFALLLLSGSRLLMAQSEDNKGINQAFMDYVDGAYAAEGERVSRGVHPELNKVIPEFGSSFLQ